MNKVGEIINVSEITKSCRNLDPNELISLLKSQINKFWSWGPNKFTIDSKSNCRMFRMKVQGHHHKGLVYIFVNGLDLFDVYFTTASSNKIKAIKEGLYFDMLVDAIDKYVEYIPQYENNQALFYVRFIFFILIKNPVTITGFFRISICKQCTN